MSFGWGIVGTGRIASQFAADLAHAPGARIAAVHSRSTGKAEVFGSEFGGARVYADLDSLLSDKTVDAVYIATPNDLHAEQALRSIAASKPVLVEKPLALSSADAELIAAAAERQGVFAMEAMWTRFLPAVRAAGEKIESGAIGEVTAITADLSYLHPEQPGSRFFDTRGGGAAFDLGVYPVSLAFHFLGRPQLVTGRWRAAASGVDIRTEIELHYPSSRASLSCGFDRDGANFFLVDGSKGALRLDPPFLKAPRLTQYSPAARDFVLTTRGQPTGLAGKILDRLPLPGRRAETFAFPGGGLQFEAVAVMEAVRNGAAQSNIMPLSQSVDVLRAIETVLARPAG